MKTKISALVLLVVVSLLFGLFGLSPAVSDDHGLSAKEPSLELVNAEKNTLLGTSTRQLTHVGPRAGEGYFSRDGQKLIFQSEREPGNPFYQIYVMDLISGETTRVSPGAGKTTCSWIHPEGKKVLYASTHLDKDLKKKVAEEYETRKSPQQNRYSWSYDENFDIFEAPLSGKGQPKRLTREKGYDAEGSYSPDGKWIAFASNRNGYTEKLNETEKKIFAQDPSYMLDIFIMRADGTEVRQLTTERGYDGGPFFSADGKKITWRHFSANGQVAEIHTMNVDGTEQKALTKLGAMSWAPYFHPSGDYLIFTTNIHGYANFELYIVDAEAKSKPVRVSFLEGFDGLPVFTPNGQEVAWTRRGANGESQILLASWNDAEARRLLNLPPKMPRLRELTLGLNAGDQKRIVEYLASENLRGRATGTPEEAIYTQAIADLFKEMGLQPAGENGSYFQNFEFTSSVVLGEKNRLVSHDGKTDSVLLSGQDWLPLSFSQTGEIAPKSIVFAGYGLVAPANQKFAAYDSYKDLDVKGKWVLVFRDVPESISFDQRYHLNVYSRAQHKAAVAKNMGAAGIIFVNGPTSAFKKELRDLKFEGGLSFQTIPVIEVTNAVANKWVQTATGKSLKSLQESLDDGKFVAGFEIEKIRLAGQIDLIAKKSIGRNVLARLKATGSKKSVMIGAHGDHLGLGEQGNSLATSTDSSKIHLGADDNASGVSGVIKLAQIFSQNPSIKSNLKQDLVFAIWSGEEIGILGSTHFTQRFSQGGKKMSDAYSAYLNMDMIGRLRDTLVVQGVASSNIWRSWLEEIATQTKMSVALQDDPYVPSDAMAIYMAGVPSLHFFTGAHSEYHTPRDTADRLHYEGINRVVSFVQSVTQRVASRTNSPLQYNRVESSKKDLGRGRSFRIYLGTIPDYVQEGVKGVRISGVSKDSPAEKAGLRGGDTIVQLDQIKVENLQDYVLSLQSMQPGRKVSISVQREGKLVELQIIPSAKE